MNKELILNTKEQQKLISCLNKISKNNKTQERIIQKRNKREEIISLIAIESILLSILIGAILSSVLFIAVTCFIGLTSLLVASISDSGPKLYLEKFLRSLSKYKVLVESRDNQVKVKLIHTYIDKFYEHSKKSEYDNLNIVQKYKLFNKYPKISHISKIDIIEEQTFEKQQDINALEYAAQLKIKAEELNQKEWKNNITVFQTTLENSKYLVPTPIKTQDQEILLLEESLKSLVQN